MKPLAIDLFCGLGGWTDGLLAEGWDVVGFDIEVHDYGDGKRYPAQMVLQDVMTIHGSQFKTALLIVASPPCQEFSYMAMPWSRAKTIAAEYRSGKRDMKELTELFDACFRIQREAIEAAGHFIPMVVENVRGAQPWVGRARWNFGSYYLWGDVPALMPITMPRRKGPIAGTGNQLCCVRMDQIQNDGVKVGDRNVGGKWTNSFADSLELNGFKTAGMNWSDRSKHGQDFTRVAGRQGVKVSGDWFGPYAEQKAAGTISPGRMHGKNSKSRKAASAAIAKIPLPMARWIGKVYRTTHKSK